MTAEQATEMLGWLELIAYWLQANLYAVSAVAALSFVDRCRTALVQKNVI